MQNCDSLLIFTAITDRHAAGMTSRLVAGCTKNLARLRQVALVNSTSRHFCHIQRR